MPYTMTVTVKKPIAPRRRNAPAFGTHLARRRDTIATAAVVQMNTNLKA